MALRRLFSGVPFLVVCVAGCSSKPADPAADETTVTTTAATPATTTLGGTPGSTATAPPASVASGTDTSAAPSGSVPTATGSDLGSGASSPTDPASNTTASTESGATSDGEPSDSTAGATDTSVVTTASETVGDTTSADPTTTGSAVDTATTGSAEANTPCTFSVQAELSSKIATVGIVNFTTDLGAVDAGYIEFGLDEQYGMRAPLNIAAMDYRTVVLGMTPSADYHYRIVAQSGDKTCISDDAVITTGAAPQGVPTPMVSVAAADKVAPGFVITSSSSANAGAGGGGAGYVLIYNQLGQLVWWYQAPFSGVTRSRISWDGQFIYGRDGNPSATANAGQAFRVSIDGLTEEDISVPSGHHDIDTTPDNAILFLTGGGGDGCSRIQKRSATGALSVIYDAREAFGDNFKTGNDPCHCNSIHYNSDDDSISVSCLSQNAYFKITQAGELLWVLGGNNNQSQFTGDVDWNRQHGHHMVTPNRILFFNNNGTGAGGGSSSIAVELELDLENMTATRVWEYDGGNSSQTLGDVQRLKNGNTLVTYCNAGVIHEVDGAGSLVQEWTFAGTTGYANQRESLYGAPDP